MIIGSYFGEIEIIFKTKRYHTTIAAESSELLTLSKQIYESIIVKDFYEIHEEVKFIAGMRHEKNMEAEKFLNQTITNNRIKNKMSFLIGKGGHLSRAIMDLKRYKKEIALDNLKRSKSLDIYKDNIIQKLISRLLVDESLVKKTIEAKSSNITLVNLQDKPIKIKTEENLKNNNKFFNWSSDSEDDNLLKKSSESKGKIAFYNKIINANKMNQNSRRPSFILNQIVQQKKNR